MALSLEPRGERHGGVAAATALLTTERSRSPPAHGWCAFAISSIVAQRRRSFFWRSSSFFAISICQRNCSACCRKYGSSAAFSASSAATFSAFRCHRFRRSALSLRRCSRWIMSGERSRSASVGGEVFTCRGCSRTVVRRPDPPERGGLCAPERPRGELRGIATNGTASSMEVPSGPSGTIWRKSCPRWKVCLPAFRSHAAPARTNNNQQPLAVEVYNLAAVRSEKFDA